MKLESLPIVSSATRASLPLWVVTVGKSLVLLSIGLFAAVYQPRASFEVTSTVSSGWHFGNRLLVDDLKKSSAPVGNEVENIFSRSTPAVSALQEEGTRTLELGAEPDRGNAAQVPASSEGKVVRHRPKPMVPRRATTVIEERTHADPATRLEFSQVDILADIRADPQRLFIDEELVTGDLVWTAKNLSPNKGLEIWVENGRLSENTYYVPYVSVDGSKTIFNNQVLQPGSKGVAAVSVNVRNKKSFVLLVGATGLSPRKWRIVLP